MRARWQVRQQAEVFNATRGHPRVLTLRMEELESGFDPAVTRLLRFLLSGSEMPRNVSGAWAAQATPLPSTSPLPLRITPRCVPPHAPLATPAGERGDGAQAARRHHAVRRDATPRRARRRPPITQAAHRLYVCISRPGSTPSNVCKCIPRPAQGPAAWQPALAYGGASQLASQFTLLRRSDSQPDAEWAQGEGNLSIYLLDQILMALVFVKPGVRVTLRGDYDRDYHVSAMVRMLRLVGHTVGDAIDGANRVITLGPGPSDLMHE